jgi:hypothetical protein
VTLTIEKVPPELQREVVKQRYFQQALRMALTCTDPRSVRDTASELRNAARNVTGAIESARLLSRDSPDWLDCARTAAVQGLAAAVGADLLDHAAHALSIGEQGKFTTWLRQLVGLPVREPARPPAPVASEAPSPPRSVPV